MNTPPPLLAKVLLVFFLIYFIIPLVLTDLFGASIFVHIAFTMLSYEIKIYSFKMNVVHTEMPLLTVILIVKNFFF